VHYKSAPSIWNLSEMLTWMDFGFLEDSDRTDIENQCSFMGAYDICSLFRGVVPIVHGPLACVNSYHSTRIVSRLKDKHKTLPFSTCMDGNDVAYSTDLGHLFHAKPATHSRGSRPVCRSEATLLNCF